MKILVINTGSSSIKYELFDRENNGRPVSGLIEKIGEKTGIITHKAVLPDGNPVKIVKKGIIHDHHEGMNRIVDFITGSKYGVVSDTRAISAVGHRVVHGGEFFNSTTIIDQNVIAAIKENIPLAPLHNPANLTGINVAKSIFPDALQVAVFDTAFHQTLPPDAFIYAVPHSMYEKNRVRKYGFHGISHAYVCERGASYLKAPLKQLNLITIHLGNGASMAAVKKGRCIDTTMGMTPLAGLVMGTRSGDIDPAILFFMADHLKMSYGDINLLLNKKSGLKGLCGTNDMREVIEKKDQGDKKAETALKIYTYRIKKYIGAFFAAMGTLDGVIFTAGIGENSSLVRDLCCRGLEGLGIKIDHDKNISPSKKERGISSPDSKVKVLVIPTDEELKIAIETEKIIKLSTSGH